MTSSVIHKIVAKPSLMTHSRTTDGKIVNYKDMFPNSTLMAQTIVTSRQQKYFVTKCYILSMFNPIKPHLKGINCSHEMLKSFVRETPPSQEVNLIPTNFDKTTERAILRKCLTGEVISSLYICDGVNDCSDGTDELNCFCYINGKVTKNNTFCAKECSLSINCVCPHLYVNSFDVGCTSYKNNNQFEKRNVSDKLLSENSQSECNYMENNLTMPCPSTELRVSKKLVNTIINCSQSDMYECYSGLSECYTKKERCVYNLAEGLQVLMYCRNGKHLQDCENMECQNMYKCKNSYCIPYRFVCDGKWDCWNGEDENVCTKDRCENMFRCGYSSVCIHVKNICDSISDCPSGEDEMLCDVQNCLPQCTCLNYGIHCYHTQLHNEYMSYALNGFVNINISHSGISLQKINYLEHTLILTCNNNSILMISLCSLTKPSLKLEYMSLGSNLITQIASVKIFCLTSLNQLSLKGNLITTVKSLVFRTLLSLIMLNLSHNHIRMLHTCAFCGLENLAFLDLTGNMILQVDKNILSNLDGSTSSSSSPAAAVCTGETN